MSLSRKRKKELRKLQDQATTLWESQQVLLGQAGNVARTAWLAAGLPLEVPGTTVDRQCGSSQQAIHFAAQGVMSGTQDVVVAGGLQNMSAIPISQAMISGKEFGFTTPTAESVGWRERFGDAQRFGDDAVAGAEVCDGLLLPGAPLEPAGDVFPRPHRLVEPGHRIRHV
mgnify:CR=1 FL=1